MLIFGCSGTADKKVPELANEMCGCFDKMKQNTTPEEMTIFKEVSVAQNPQEALTDGIKRMDQAKAMAFAEKIKAIGDKSSSVAACMETFDKKHEKETTKDRTALTEKLFAQLQATNCIIGAAIVNLSLKHGK